MGPTTCCIRKMLHVPIVEQCYIEIPLILYENGEKKAYA